MRTWLLKPGPIKSAGFTFATVQILEADGLQLMLLSLFIFLQRRHLPSRISAIDNYRIYDNGLSVKYPLETKRFLKQCCFRRIHYRHWIRAKLSMPKDLEQQLVLLSKVLDGVEEHPPLRSRGLFGLD